MVAITVILAAVIGTFVLGLGDQIQNTTPQASFGFDTADSQSNVTVTHQSGASIAAADLTLRTQSVEWNTTDDSDSENTKTWAVAADTDGDVTAGSTVTMRASNGTDYLSFAGDTIRVVYDSPDSDTSSTLGKFEVPE
jgi:FlaG/FlaF family flagellin (archaellin)